MTTFGGLLHVAGDETDLAGIETLSWGFFWEHDAQISDFIFLSRMARSDFIP